MRILPVILTVALAGVTLSCRSTTPAGTRFDTDPPGARVVIDGEDSGYLTPCRIELDRGDDHEIRFELVGYEPATLSIEPARSTEFVPWTKGNTHESGYSFPLLLPGRDLLNPVQTDRSFSTERVHVRLAPVTSE